jgi:hypothetical protein
MRWMGTPDPSADVKAETMRIATKVGIVLATVGMTIGLLGSPAEANKDTGWPKSGQGTSAKYIP